MKALKTLAFLSTVLCITIISHAQINDTGIRSRALLYADSLNSAYRNNHFNEYISISYPGVIRYYGGTQDFREYFERSRMNNSNFPETAHDDIQLIQLEKKVDEWQSVVQKIHQTIIDGRKAQIISYMVGQSKDKGNTWTYFDVAYNSTANLVYIMPDIFDNLSVPQRQIIFEKDELPAKEHQAVL